MKPLAIAVLLSPTICLAQKWVDEKGKIYYGDPPPGISVKRAPMGGGTSSAVGSQGGGGGRSTSQQEQEFQKRNAARQASAEREERDQRVTRHNEKVMENNKKVWQERYENTNTKPPWKEPK